MDAGSQVLSDCVGPRKCIFSYVRSDFSDLPCLFPDFIQRTGCRRAFRADPARNAVLAEAFRQR